MTVCIAAINKEHNLVAFAADRMVTATLPPIEFEHTLPKLHRITDYCIGLSAGDALLGKEIFDTVKEIAKKEKVEKKLPTIKSISNQVKDVYQRIRLQRIETIQLRSRGINHQVFIEQGAKLLHPNVYAQIDHAFATNDLGLEALIIGVDESGPSIYSVRNPGVINCFDSIGFHAIGSGQMHAVISLIETYDPKGEEAKTIYSVFKAKKIAEVAPGVGSKTDIGILKYKEIIKDFDENAELFKKLNELWNEEKKHQKSLTESRRFGNLKEEVIESIEEKDLSSENVKEIQEETKNEK